MLREAFIGPFLVFLNPIGVAAICAICAALLVPRVAPAENDPQSFSTSFSVHFLYAIPVAMAAFAAGYLAGTSRAPAIGSLLPAVLALIGGLNIYVFGTSDKYRAVVGYCVIVFCLCLIQGTYLGAVARELGRVERLIRLSDQEFHIRLYRKNLDLDASPPNWLVGTEPK